MGANMRSIVVAIVGIGFIIASRYIPKEWLTLDMQNLVTQLLCGLYAIFMACKGNKILAKLNAGGK
jgi:hypothetical protein